MANVEAQKQVPIPKAEQLWLVARPGELLSLPGLEPTRFGEGCCVT